MSKYTPGPWNFAHRRRYDGMYDTEIFDSEGNTVATAAWYALPKTHEGMTSTNRMENARLIAAAPDLLEALKSFAGVENFAGWHPKYESAIEKARAAIAKATGEAK